MRMEGHGVHDDASYVPRELLGEWTARDPIERYRAWLRTNVGFDQDEEAAMRDEVKRVLADALRRAEESPLPSPDELLDGVYAEAEDVDAPHFR
jgi:TPP-dependent pyruvate/acetoin dehydrogenase alpha subunit